MYLPRKLSTLFKSMAIGSLRNYQVSLVGGTTQTGQTLALLLSGEPAITRLHIHDTPDYTSGVVLDISHIPTETTVRGFVGNDTLESSIQKSDIIIATGGVAPMPGLSKNDLIQTNTNFIRTLASKIALLQPMPFVGILVEPINSLVPIAAEIIRSHGNYDPKKLFGITTIDALRAQTLYAAERNLSPSDCVVPVIGGHSNRTMIPLLTHAKPTCEMTEKSIHEFTSKIRRAEEYVVEEKKGWSSTFSMAYSGLMFARAIIGAMDGKLTRVNAFVENNDFGTSFFSGLVYVDKKGAGEMQRYTNLSHYECYLLEHCIVQLKRDVWTGRKVLEVA